MNASAGTRVPLLFFPSPFHVLSETGGRSPAPQWQRASLIFGELPHPRPADPYAYSTTRGTVPLGMPGRG